MGPFDRSLWINQPEPSSVRTYLRPRLTLPLPSPRPRASRSPAWLRREPPSDRRRGRPERQSLCGSASTRRCRPHRSCGCQGSLGLGTSRCECGSGCRAPCRWPSSNSSAAMVSSAMSPPLIRVIDDLKVRRPLLASGRAPGVWIHLGRLSRMAGSSSSVINGAVL